VKILLTGASGFLGRTICNKLNDDYEVITIGKSQTSQIRFDLAGQSSVSLVSSELVVHAAGRAHLIPQNESEKSEFKKVNVDGTINLLHALDTVPQLPKCFVFISTVAVYGLDEGANIDETAPLNGNTPYAISKLAAEKVVTEWCSCNHVNCVILRLPLVVGKEAPGNLGKMRRAIQKGLYVSIKGNPARKSVVNAEDIAKIIPALVDKQGIFNLTDGYHPLFSQIEDAIARETGKPVRFSLHIGLLRLIAKIGDYITLFPLNTARLQKMTSTLTFSDTKARAELGWNPQPAFQY
jgi:nucleoside-diphosphate-sugar epimerase